LIIAQTVKKILTLMKPDRLLPCSQKHAIAYMLSQLNPLHAVTPFPYVYFNIMSHLCLGLLKWSLVLGFTE